MSRLRRRLLLVAPLTLVACGEDEVSAPNVRRDFPPLRYAYLPPINLNVQKVEMAGDYAPATSGGEIIGASPVDPVETLYAMARDRLKPVGTGDRAIFRILNASIMRRRDGLSGELAVRLDVRKDDDTNTGFVNARVTADRSGLAASQRAVVYDMLKSLLDDMNVELEYQIRGKLRPWVVELPAPGPQPVPPSEKLPPPPAFVERPKP
jgi:hypothetical protein